MDPVRIAMLGAGFVAEFYMQGLKDVGGHEVVVAASRNEDTVNTFARRWDIPETSTSVDDTIARDDIDLYLIALPNAVHKDVAVALARNGRNQVCTKPLARSGAEAREILDAVNEAGVLHGYAETEVFSPAVVRAEGMIRAGSIGKVLWVRSRESHFGPHAPWFWDPELAGGGALVDMGCHCFEAARYFHGKDVRPVEVMCWADTLHHDSKAEDNALAILRFENGGIGHAEVSWTSRGGLDLRNEIHGTEGAIFTDVTRSTPIEAFTTASSGYVVEKAESEQGWVKPVPEEAFVYGYQAEMKHFVDCIRTGTMPRENYHDGYVINTIIDAAYRSTESRTWEPIDL
ncbi:MAG TPA: Gfo/Idh/MocA family oxidoreductase [Chloroflexota bacterium]